MSATQLAAAGKSLTGTILRGTIVSAKGMRKTVKVEVPRLVLDKRSRKTYVRHSTYLVHDEHQECDVGQRVVIRSTKPISTAKHFKVVLIENPGQRGVGAMGRFDSLLKKGGRRAEEAMHARAQALAWRHEEQELQKARQAIEEVEGARLSDLKAMMKERQKEKHRRKQEALAKAAVGQSRSDADASRQETPSA